MPALLSRVRMRRCVVSLTSMALVFMTLPTEVAARTASRPALAASQSPDAYEVFFTGPLRFGSAREGGRALLEDATVDAASDLHYLSLVLPGEDTETVFELHANRELLPASYVEGVTGQEGISFDGENRERRARGLFQGESMSSPARRGLRRAAFSWYGDEVRGLVLDSGDHHYVDYTVGAAATRIRTLRSKRSSPGQTVDESVPVAPPKVINYTKTQSSPNGLAQLPSSTAAATASSVSELDTLYIEVFAVSDADRVAYLDTGMQGVYEDTATVMNMVDLLYASQDWGTVSMRLSLAGQLLFNASDPYPVNASAVSNGETDSLDLLGHINTWRNEHLAQLPSHDILHMLSAKDFDGQTVGLAYLGTACDDNSACDEIETMVNGDPNGYCLTSEGSSDYLGCCSRNAASISQIEWETQPSAVIVAHEIGHQLGFEHDGTSGSVCESASATAHIMAAYVNTETRDILPSFSSCSVSTLQSRIQASASAYGYHELGCLANVPEGLESNGTTGSRDGTQAPAMASAGMLEVPLMLLALCSMMVTIC